MSSARFDHLKQLVFLFADFMPISVSFQILLHCIKSPRYLHSLMDGFRARPEFLWPASAQIRMTIPS